MIPAFIEVKISPKQTQSPDIIDVNQGINMTLTFADL